MNASSGITSPPASPPPPPFAVHMDWAITWPLYTVYPISTLLFTSLYLAGPFFWPLILPYYGNMSTLNRKCWRQNTNAMLHTLILCPLLLVAIMTDPEMQALRPLHPHIAPGSPHRSPASCP